MAPVTLLDLPLELFRAILAECIRVRGIKRAFRLRLVNRYFVTTVIQVVNELRMLDDCSIPMDQTGNVGIDYMSRRLLNPKLPVSPVWDGVRRIAARLAIEDNNNSTGYETYLKLLCTRASHYNCPSTMAAVCAGRLEPNDMSDTYSEEQYEYDLMAAAAYTNKLSVIQELSANAANLGITIGTFGNPFMTTVIGGNPAALDMLFEKLNERSVDRVKRLILAQVALHGSPSMVEKCMPNWNPKHLAFRRSQYLATLNSALVTPHVETFKIVMRIKETTPDPTLSDNQLAQALDRACWRGWEEMARHLISLGAPVYGDYLWYTRDYRPLKSASGRGNEAIVQLLLEHGARIEGDEIGEAAKKGRWNVVRLLIAHGADASQAIVSAVVFERKDIVLELAERGAVLTGEIGAQGLETAKKEGLKSMLAFLEELGADLKVENLEDGVHSLSMA